MNVDLIQRSILESPHDDAPRLQLAQWHHDHSRWGWAEFIRLQIDLALGLHLPACEADPAAAVVYLCDLAECRYCHARRREWDLVQELIPGPHPKPSVLRLFDDVPGRWCERVRLAGWAYHDDLTRGHMLLSRGLVREVRCTALEWLEIAPKLLALQPIERVTFTDTPGLSLLIGKDERGWGIDGHYTFPAKRGIWTNSRVFQSKRFRRRDLLAKFSWAFSAASMKGVVDLAEAHPQIGKGTTHVGAA